MDQKVAERVHTVSTEYNSTSCIQARRDGPQATQGHCVATALIAGRNISPNTAKLTDDWAMDRRVYSNST